MKTIFSELPPPRVSVLKRMIIGDVVLFRDSRFNAVSAAFAKVPDMVFEQQTSIVVGGNKGLAAAKVIVVKRKA